MISVIVPVYNCITTLERCIQSILGQTRGDWELLLVDDGSTDGSGALCDRFADNDARIRVLHKANGGVSSARNLGLDYARGEFALFCDSDDWAEPQWCDRLYQAASARPNALPVCNYYRDSASGPAVNQPAQCAALSPFVPRADFFLLNQQELLGIPWNKIFRISILNQHQIRFRPALSLGEDLIFVLDYLRHVDGLMLINAPLYHYSVGNETSLSVRFYPNLTEIYQIIYSRIREEMESIPLSWKKWESAYQKSYFFAFDRVFRNTWSKQNNISLPGKWQDNATVFHSKDFQATRRIMLNQPMNRLQRLGLKSNCFILYWLTVSVSERISAQRRKGGSQ